MSEEIKAIHWTTTERARDDALLASAGLSVRQRKLLTLAATPMTVAALADAAKMPAAEVETSLRRFATLGLAASDEVIPPSPMLARPTSFSNAAPPPVTTSLGAHTKTGVSALAAATVRKSSSDAPIIVTVDNSLRAPTIRAPGSKMPMIAGGAALSLIVAAIWFFMRPSAPVLAPVAAGSVNNPVANTAASNAVDSAAPSAVIAPAPSSAAVAAAALPAGPAALAKPLTPRELAAEKAAAEKVAKAAADAAKLATKEGAQPAPAAAVPTTAQASTAPAPQAPIAATTATAPAPVPVAATPTPEPASVVAVAAPAAAAPAPRPAAPAAAREPKLIDRVEPGFPRGAEADNGLVRARLAINGNGAVTGVEIIESNPPRVFDRSVRAALQQWKYEAIGEPSTKLVEISFKR